MFTPIRVKRFRGCSNALDAGDTMMEDKLYLPLRGFVASVR